MVATFWQLFVVDRLPQALHSRCLAPSELLVDVCCRRLSLVPQERLAGGKVPLLSDLRSPRDSEDVRLAERLAQCCLRCPQQRMTHSFVAEWPSVRIGEDIGIWSNGGETAL